MYNLLLFILIAGFSISCSGNRRSEVEFTENSFSVKKSVTNLSCYNNPLLFLGHPTSIKFHPDSFLVVEEYGPRKLLKIIDLKNDSIQEIIGQGKGPGEMIVSWGISILNGEIYSFCGQLRKVIILSYDKERKFHISREYKLEENQTSRFYPLSENLLVCLSRIGDDSRLTFLDGSGRITRKMGQYPDFETKDKIKPDNDIFFGPVSGTPDGNTIYLACNKTDIIEIYNPDKGLIKRLQGPLGIHLTARVVNQGFGSMVQTIPFYSTYSQIVCNNKEFWLDFNGYRVTGNKPPTTEDQYSKKIFCFNRNGSPLRLLVFEKPVISFDVDWQNKMLYFLTLINNEPHIVYCPLKEII